MIKSWVNRIRRINGFYCFYCWKSGTVKNMEEKEMCVVTCDRIKHKQVDELSL